MTAPIIEVQDLWHWYLRGTPLESIALRGASFSLAAGEVVGVMGHTGSGKSTLVQHFNALLRPHRGSVRVFGLDPISDTTALQPRVGVMLQQGGAWSSVRGSSRTCCIRTPTSRTA